MRYFFDCQDDLRLEQFHKLQIFTGNINPTERGAEHILVRDVPGEGTLNRSLRKLQKAILYKLLVKFNSVCPL